MIEKNQGTATRRIGLIGGMSWHSTIDYYRLINSEVEATLGGHHSADLVMASLDFEQIRACQVAEDWAGANRLLSDAARRLEGAGAEAVLICTNLMHKCAPAVEAAVDVPLLHIGDAVAARADELDVTRLGVVGTRWVMEETFYSDRLARHGISTVVPDAEARVALDVAIFAELTKGIVTDESRVLFRTAFQRLADQGAEAIVLACTEIQLLVDASDSPVPLIDSMAAHAAHATRFALRTGVSHEQPATAGV